MGAGSGGRLGLSLFALLVLMASGVAGTKVFGSGPEPSAGGSHHQDRMVGSTLLRQPAQGRKASPLASTSSRAPGPASARPRDARPQPAASAAGRFNVGATHSPELLQQMDGPLLDTGRPAGSRSAGTSSPAGGSAATSAGVDVAAVQHPDGAAIDWAQVAAAGYTFAAIKATEGDYYVNPYYASDVVAAKAAGLYVMGYHFAIPNVSAGVAQADYAVRQGDYAGDGRTLPLELDAEYDPYTSIDHTNECYGLNPAQMVSWISAFVREAQRLTGQLPIVYTAPGWWNACTADTTALGADPLWIAAYAPANPPMPPGWPDWSFWQYTSSGTVPGITPAGGTDVSYGAGSKVTLVDPVPQPGKPGSVVSRPGLPHPHVSAAASTRP